MEPRRIPRFCFLLTALLTLVGVILRTVCMLCLYDPAIGYFARGPLPTLSNALYFVALLLPILCMMRTPKGLLPDDLVIPGRTFPLLVTALVLGSFTVANLVAPALFAGIPEQFMTNSSKPVAEGLAGKLTEASNLLALPAAFYFLLSVRKDGRYPDWLAFLGYLPVIWGAASVADTYFDRYVAMNSPAKIALQLGFMGFMLICLAELRFRVDKALPRYSTVFLCVGSYACLVGSIPLLIAACARVFEHPRYTFYAAVQLCAGLYGLYLLLHYTAPQSAPADPTEAPSTETPNTAE